MKGEVFVGLWLLVDGILIVVCNVLPGRTISTLPLPLSFRLKRNESSSPVLESWRVRKAWCARLGVLPSVVVRTILRVSDGPNDTSLESGEAEENLICVRILPCAGDSQDSLLSQASAYTGTFALDCQGGIVNAPGRCKSRSDAQREDWQQQ